MADKTKRMKVLELIQDWKLWPRHEAGKLDSSNVAKLRDVLKAGVKFNTPIIVDAASLRIIDGFHRCRAYLDVVGDDAETEVVLRDYPDEITMRCEAAHYANSGSLQLTAKDKAHFIIGMRRDHVPWPRIAEALDLDADRCKKMLGERSLVTQSGERIAVSAASVVLVKHLDGGKADAEQEFFARTSPGNPPMMYARILLNALRAFGSIEYDEKTVAVLVELRQAIDEVVAKVKV